MEKGKNISDRKNHRRSELGVIARSVGFAHLPRQCLPLVIEGFSITIVFWIFPTKFCTPRSSFISLKDSFSEVLSPKHVDSSTSPTTRCPIKKSVKLICVVFRCSWVGYSIFNVALMKSLCFSLQGHSELFWRLCSDLFALDNCFIQNSELCQSQHTVWKMLNIRK